MINYRRDCGGCEGKGAHWRWCQNVVGERSWFLGCLGDEASHLADSVGSNNTSAANYLYASASLLHDQAHVYDVRHYLATASDDEVMTVAREGAERWRGVLDRLEADDHGEREDGGASSVPS